MVRSRIGGIAAPFVALVLTATACAGKKAGPAGQGAPAGGGSSAPVAKVAAADLRAGLTGLLSEHVYLASLATGAALRGDTEGFTAFSAALNGPANSNTSDLVSAITGIYGEETGKAFDGLWRSAGHIPAFVAYTQAVAKDDQAAAAKAVQDLLAYAGTFGTTMHEVNPQLPADAVESAIKMHVNELKAVVDAQKAGDPAKEYAALRAAYGHMAGTAAVLAGATVARFPEKFEGDAGSKASELRAGMTLLLREHVFLAAGATGAALRGDNKGFEAAATALNGPQNSNTADIVTAIRGVYGDEVGTAFDGLWRSKGHIPAVVAYTKAAAGNDAAGMEAAVQELLAYAKTFGATLNQVNSNLPAPAVEEAIKMHITDLKAVIDAQKAGDKTKTAAGLRDAVHHMSDTANVLSGATVAKFPDKFPA